MMFSRLLLRKKKNVLIIMGFCLGASILICKSAIYKNPLDLVPIDILKPLIEASYRSRIKLVLWDLPASLTRNALDTSQSQQMLIFALPVFPEISLKRFLGDLKNLQFRVEVFSNHSKVETHYFLTKNGYPIHIFLLYWSAAGFWRQYAMEGYSTRKLSFVKQYMSQSDWSFLNADRAFDSYKTKKIWIEGRNMFTLQNSNRIFSNLDDTKFIECNKTQANIFISKYPPNNSETSKNFRHKAHKLLTQTKNIMDKLNIPFWISGGTALGYYRQCDFMDWAKDVDIGVHIEKYNDDIITEFEKAGLPLIHKFGKVNDSLELSFIKGIKLDIFFFYSDGRTLWNGATQAKTGKKFKYVYESFTLCWTEFANLKVRIPCQIESYVLASYGRKWNIPIKAWDWKTSPPNARENGMWSPSQLNEVVFKHI